MKVVILADSLSLPRGREFGNVPYEATYPYLLDSYLRSLPGDTMPVVIERGMRFRTIKKVLEDWTELVELRAADYVVVHVGIVDCAPRVFTPAQRKFVEGSLSGSLRRAVLKFVHGHRRTLVRMQPHNVYVSEDDFAASVTKVVDLAKLCKLRGLIFVNIISPPDELEQRSPGYQRNVATYNAILTSRAHGESVHLVDLNFLVEQNGGVERLTCDGMHINALGHEILARDLLKQLTS